MSSTQEWQAKVDEDFPHGSLLSNSRWKDQDGTPSLFRTASVTVVEINSTGLPVLHVWLDEFFEKDAKITVLSYDVTKGAHLLAKIRTPDTGTWLLSDNIPAKVASTPRWKALRTAERAVPLGLDVSPEVAELAGMNA